MTLTDNRKSSANKRKVLSHVYSLVDAIIGFFAVWTFAAMMKIVVGLSTEVYWLAKSSIQQFAFIGVAVAMFGVIIGGQYLYERSMIAHETWVPKSFIVITSIIVAVYAVCKIIVVTY